jgi:acid phosphatase class B
MKSNRVVAAVDVDDCVCDFLPAFTLVAHKLFGVRSDLLPVDWTFSNYGLSKEQINKVWEALSRDKEFWFNLPRRSDAPVGSMHRLRGVTKYFITARTDILVGGNAQKVTSAWIAEKFYGGEPRPCVIAGARKGETCRVLGVTHFLDDSEANCLDVVQSAPECKVYIKDYSHNQSFRHPAVQRVASFDEFASIVSKEARQ